MSKDQAIIVHLEHIAANFPDAMNETIRALIRSSGSRIGAVTFLKKDGTIRHLAFQNARDNMKAGRIVGSERGAKAAATRARNHPDLELVFGHNEQDFRCFYLPRVLKVRVNGHTYRVRRKEDIAP